MKDINLSEKEASELDLKNKYPNLRGLVSKDTTNEDEKLDATRKEHEDYDSIEAIKLQFNEEE